MRKESLNQNKKTRGATREQRERSHDSAKTLAGLLFAANRKALGQNESSRRMTAKILVGGVLMMGFLVFGLFSAVNLADATTLLPNAVAPWNDIAQIIYNNNVDGWSPVQTTSTTTSDSVAALEIYGGSDNGGYCMAYWGGSEPGYAAAYFNDGLSNYDPDTDTYNSYNDGSFPPAETCPADWMGNVSCPNDASKSCHVDSSSNWFCSLPCDAPTFYFNGKAKLCQLNYLWGDYQYFKNYKNGTSRYLSGLNIPAGTAINLKAQHNNGGGPGYTRCFLKAVYTKDLPDFPSHSMSDAVGNLTNGNIKTLCHDGEYVAGLNRGSSNDEQSIQIYCAPAPSQFQSDFKSFSESTPTGLVIPTDNSKYEGEWCPNGQYMSGIERYNQGGSRNAWKIYCSLAPPALQKSFMSSSASHFVGNFEISIFTTCPDGQYMSGLRTYREKMGGYSTDYRDSTQIQCANALTGFLNNDCFPGNPGTCVTGLVCDSSDNICKLPAGLGLLCDPSLGCAGSAQCDSITHTCVNSSMCSGGKLPGNEWTESFRSLNGGAAYGYGTAVDQATGDVYMTGEVLNAATATSGLDVFLRKYDSGGNLKWEKIYDNGGNESGYGVAVNGGEIYVTGRQGTNGDNVLIQEYNAATGNLNWSGSAPGTNIGKAVATADVSGSRVIFVVGHQQNSSGDIDAAMWRYDAGGNLLSGASPIIYNTGTNNESANAITISGSDLYVAGYTSTNNGDALILKYSTAGNWAKAYDSTPISNPSPQNTDIGNGVAVVPASGKVFVTGYESINGGDMFLVSYNAASGDFIKEETAYDSVSGKKNNDVGRGIISGGTDGRLYISGSQQTSGEDAFSWASSLTKPIISLYKGGANSFSIERGFGLASYKNTDNNRDEIYVAGYQDSNGGEAFLSKYSCNLPRQSTSISNAYFNVTPAVIYSDAKVTVNATKSGPEIKSYDWNWGDGSVTTGVISDHAYKLPGIVSQDYTITLTLDGTTTVSQKITVYFNHSPTASFIVDPAGGGAAPLVVKVDGSASDPDGVDTDPGDYIKSFTWQWGDNTADGHGEKTTHLYSSAGSYKIALIVADSNGATASALATVNVVKQYVCDPVCSGTKPACWANSNGVGNQCYQCVPGTEYQCASGMKCLGTTCQAGQKCADGVECPADGICAEAVACKAPGVCADGSYCPSSGQCPNKSCTAGEKTCAGNAVCPSNGICPTETCKPAGSCPDGNTCSNSGWCPNSLKNMCVLGSETAMNQCYTEANGVCASDADCNAGIQGGACDLNEKMPDGTTANPYYKQCKYAHCLNFTDNSCKTDKDCNNADGVCDPSKKTCDYVYDCAYGPGMNSGATSTVVTLIPKMPLMPVGIQPDGQACTKPTADAPTNCEGINGCLYYNYYIEAVNNMGVPMPGDAGSNAIGNGVASCLNKFEGGTGCVYYGDQAASTSLANCLPGTDFKKLKPKAAPPGISPDCVAFDKGGGKKEYDCTGVNGCYYYLNGAVDCDYVGGTGCIYEPNPAGAQMCPKTAKPPTSGKDFVQCLLNPDALLPAFLLSSGTNNLSACRVNADCPADAPICLDGTCYPKCQSDKSCVTGESCVQSCQTKNDCQIDCAVGTKCPSGADCVADSASSTGGSCPVVCNAGVCQACSQVGNCPITGGFSCFDTTAVHKLDYGTPSTPVSVSSSQNASCKWSLLDLPFVNMEGSFSTGDSVNHTATAVGLPDAGTATIFAKCDDGAGKTATCNVPLTIGTLCGGNNAACPSGMECRDDGFCRDPICANAQPSGTLPFNTISIETSMTTDRNSNCVYSNNASSTSACIAPILSCSTATPFTTTGAKAHSSLLSRPPLVEGNNTQYAKCQETESSQNKLSGTCRIPFSIGTCNPHSVINECSEDWQCVGIGSGPGVCIPPACDGAKPVGTLPYTALTADFGLTTNATSTCAYSGDYNDAYSAMTPFAETGGKAHSSNTPVTRNSEVYRYARCKETATGKETPDACTIHFKVGDLLPICNGAHPTRRQDVGATPAIGLTTNQSAACKFADTYDNSVTQEARYNNMTDSLRHTADGVTHGSDGTLQDTVTVVQGDNTKYVACRETSAPNKITECRIPFSGKGTCIPGTNISCSDLCPFGSQYNPVTGDCYDICDQENPNPPDWCFRCVGPDCHRNPCDIMPDLPQCHPTFCSLHPDDPTCSGGGSCNTLGYEFHGSAIKPSGNCSLLAIILALLSWLAWVVALLAVFSGLRAAYLYITSAGDEKKLRLAYSYLIYTTIGVGVAILSFSAVAITRAIFNI